MTPKTKYPHEQIIGQIISILKNPIFPLSIILLGAAILMVNEDVGVPLIGLGILYMIILLFYVLFLGTPGGVRL